MGLAYYWCVRMGVVRVSTKGQLLPVGCACVRERLLVGRAGIGGFQVSVDLADVGGPGVGLWQCHGCMWTCCCCVRLRCRCGCWSGRWQDSRGRRRGHQGQAGRCEAEGRAAGQVGHLLDAVKGFVGA